MPTAEHEQHLHPKADVQRLYIPRNDAATATIGLDHYLKRKEGQYPEQVLERERSKANISKTKNANKFTREVTMPEFENREDKSLRKRSTPKTHVQVQDKINDRRKVEKQSIAWPVSKDPREASYRHSHHQHTVIK